MVLGQFLLLVFIMLWLRSQYKQSEFELQKDLGRVFTESTQELQDTILKARFINPLIESQNTSRPRMMTMEYQVMTQSDTVRTMNVDNNTTMLQPMLFEVADSSGVYDTQLKRTYSVTDSSSEMLADVVTIFFDEIRQENDTTFKLFIFNHSEDSVLKRILNEKLKNWDLNIEHMVEYEPTRFQPVNNFTFNSDVFGNTFQVRYAGMEREIWLRILPQILFSLLLFLIIGSAFYLLYRNLKTQVQLYAQQSQFVANVSHELRTPISTVKVALESIQSYAGSRDENLAREYLGMANAELNRLENLVSGVLQNSLLEGGGLKLNCNNHDLPECVRKSIFAFQSTNQGSNETIEFITGEKFICSFDELHVQGVILNLLDNARKYGGSQVKVDISTKGNGSKYILSVCDNGPGIPDEYKDKIFDRFFRIPTGDVHDVKGYGLGLTYCLQVMRLHGGDLKLADHPNGGTCFLLEFPVQ